jgi:hypothetical protein
LKHTLATCMYMQHLDETLKTYVWNTWNTWYIRLQHETYACNMRI